MTGQASVLTQLLSWYDVRMSEKVLPASTALAAKRAFIRTAAQSLSAAIPTGAIAIALTQDFWVGAGLGVAGAIVTSVLAGTASALMIVSNGVPEEYQAPAPSPHEGEGFVARG